MDSIPSQIDVNLNLNFCGCCSPAQRKACDICCAVFSVLFMLYLFAAIGHYVGFF